MKRYLWVIEVKDSFNQEWVPTGSTYRFKWLAARAKKGFFMNKGGKARVVKYVPQEKAK